MSGITDERIEELGAYFLERIPHPVASIDKEFRDLYSCLEELLRRRQAERQFILDLNQIPSCED